MLLLPHQIIYPYYTILLYVQGTALCREKIKEYLLEES